MQVPWFPPHGAERASAQDGLPRGLPFLGVAAQKRGCWGRRLPRGPGSVGLALCGLVCEQDGVGGDSCSLEIRGKTIGRTSLLWTRALLPTLTSVWEFSGWSYDPKISAELALSQASLIFSERSLRSAFWSKGPTSDTVLSYTGETCMIREECYPTPVSPMLHVFSLNESLILITNLPQKPPLKFMQLLFVILSILSIFFLFNTQRVVGYRLPGDTRMPSFWEINWGRKHNYAQLCVILRVCSRLPNKKYRASETDGAGDNREIC